MKEAEEQLKTAVKDGDSTRVQESLSALPPKYNKNIKIAYICLKAALERRSPEEIVRLLLNKFSQISLKQYFFPLLLNIAIKKCNAATVEVLLEHGSDPNTHYSLHCACQAGMVKIVELLVKFGADVNLVNLKHKSPLHCALDSTWNTVELVKILLENEADANLPDSEGALPLHLTLSKGMHFDLIELIMKAGSNVNGRNKNGETAVLVAAKKNFYHSGSSDIISHLASLGADLNIPDNEGTTPLHSACVKGKLSLVNLLLIKGANINAKDNNGCTPLFMSAQNCWHRIICHLVYAGADVNAHCTNGDTPLHVLGKSRYSSTETVYFLLKHNADPNSKNNEGLTPFFVALTTKNWMIADQMATYGRPDVTCVITSSSPVFAEFRGMHPYSCGLTGIAPYIIKRIVLRMSQDLFVNEVHLLEIEGNDQLKAIRDRCVEEINRMKIEVIGGSDVTYYDVMVKDVNQLASLARNPFLADAFGKFDCLKCPQYRRSLSDALKKGLERRKLIVRTTRFCEAAFSGLPTTCVDMILEYLPDSDLHRLIDVYQPQTWSYYRN